MNSNLYICGIVLVLLTVVASGCGTATATVEPTTGLANPASVYCEEQGYTREMRTDADGGQYGVCVFPDGSECEEWAFYRGECKPAPVSETATDTPQAPDPAPTPEAPKANDPYPGWASYVNADCGA